MYMYISYIILAYPVLQGGGSIWDPENCNAVLGHFWETFFEVDFCLHFEVPFLVFFSDFTVQN